MKLMLDINISPPSIKINYPDSIFLIGSCFTEHMGKRLEELKFPVLQNPNGILFDPLSVTRSIESYIENKQYEPGELFYLNELWQSWNHHSVFSQTDQIEAIKNINNAQQSAHDFLKQAKWLIVTLGSSFYYQLTDNNQPVANCHRAPGQWFKKELLSTLQTVDALTKSIIHLKKFNPALQIIFTISPVRHIRDGVVQNNRSKARLIEAVHQVVEESEGVYYFPAYEIVIDVLRDYRFYDIDLVHPNYAATEFVFEQFEQSFIADDAKFYMEDIRKINNGCKHKPFHPDTQSHQTFLKTMLEKVQILQQKLPLLNFSKELAYLSSK